MKIKISYFYQIRFFKPYQIPISTALSDPKWYHNNKTNKHCFIDKRGVINGLRCSLLHPQTSECVSCSEKNPPNCLFLQHYYEYLSSIDFNAMINGFEEKFHQLLKDDEYKDKLELILIVHEAPTNHCSEREMLVKWFADNGYELEEFHKEE